MENTKKRNGAFCDICNSSIPMDDVIEKAARSVNKDVCFIRNENHVICPNCVSTYLQFSRLVLKEKKLLALYSQTLKLNQYQWSDTLTSITTSIYINDIMNLSRYKEDEIYIELSQPIRYRSIVVNRIFDNYIEVANSVMGVSLPEHIQVSSMNPNVIACPPSDFGYIKLPQKDDFIIFVKSNFNELSVLEQSLNEMKSISQGEMSPRAGSASGYMLPSIQCKSLSEVTNNERLLCIRKKSVGMSVTYRNKNGDVKGRNAVYNDLYMSRYNSRNKFKYVLKSTAFQRLLLKEMTSRLQAFILLDKCNVLPIHKSLSGFMNYDTERMDMEKNSIYWKDAIGIEITCVGMLYWRNA